mmetsp:Transcript_23987/g.45571  ORF Transcript_23987/g.45571 Transcript_23987/m.45571 type:complete len:295 (-) Transcript_23987:992-1876(-)
MSSIPDPVLDGGSFIDYFVHLPQPSQEGMPEDGKTQFETHAAWYDTEDHETVSILSVSTKTHPLGVWMCTQIYLMESPCCVTAWDTLARFMAHGGGGCTLNTYRPLMSMAGTSTCEDGELELFVVVSVDTSKRTHDCVMFGVVYLPSHTGDRYRDVPYELMCFEDPAAPMSQTVHMPKVLNVSGEHVIPQSVRQARSLKDADKWLAAEEEEMESIKHTKVITHTSVYLPEGIIAIITIFIYALKLILLSTIERYKARWVVRGFMEIPDVHFNPHATHTHVALDSSLLIMISLVV